MVGLLSFYTAMELPTSHLDAAHAAALNNPRKAKDAVLREAVEQALTCPCFDDIRHGPCWKQFAGAFTCYGLSKADARGEECSSVYEPLLRCMDRHQKTDYPELKGVTAANPNANVASANDDGSSLARRRSGKYRTVVVDSGGTQRSESNEGNPLPGVEGSTERTRGPRPAIPPR